MSELRTIDQQALLTPDKPALVMAHDGSAVTFAELVERSARAANLLRRLGLRPGDGIAVISTPWTRCAATSCLIPRRSTSSRVEVPVASAAL